MVIAIIFSAIIAVVVASFAKLAQSESRLANVAFYANNSLNLAEGGVERALYALNFNEWSGWTVSEDKTALMAPTKTVSGSGETTLVQVLVRDYDTNPLVIVEGMTFLTNRPAVTKQLEVSLKRRSLFANGVTARDGITFKGGQASVDSYRSSLGKWHFTNNSFDNGSVSSPSVAVDAVDLSNARIKGRVATGGSEPKVGPNGSIRGDDTPIGVRIDPTRVALDFDSDFATVDPPTFSSSLGTISATTSIGNPLATSPTGYLVNGINLANKELNIIGPVILYVTGDISVSGGSGSITVHETGSAIIFVDGDVSVSGNGAVNSTNTPSNLLIYGTNPISQTFDFSGNAELQGAIYAPEAVVNLKGGGTSGVMSGAVVAKMISINGNYDFHYDEDLGDISGPNPTFRMERWRELYLASDRFDFGN